MMMFHQTCLLQIGHKVHIRTADMFLALSASRRRRQGRRERRGSGRNETVSVKAVDHMTPASAKGYALWRQMKPSY